VAARVLGGTEGSWKDVAAVYVVGGGSELPLVGRILRERYGRRVRRSPYPHAATAIGLAVAAGRETAVRVQERFTRHFGVWREAESGRQITFDPIFSKDTTLPTGNDAPLQYVRTYTPAHNVGHFRYLECSRLREDGQPSGDIMPWSEIRFPFDPLLRDETKLEQVPVRRCEGVASQLIQESYLCDPHGIIEVTISNQSAGYEHTYRLRGNEKAATDSTDIQKSV
jgi:molecular chaperone DnaK (HSP70)